MQRQPATSLSLSLPVLLLALAACGGGSEAGSSDGGEGSATETATATAGGIPVSEPTEAVDPELAARGEELFRTRGCVACHTVGGGRRVGPDLAGVTERRDFAWTYHMVTSPDSMVRNDSIARRLLSEYFTPMSDQGVTPEQFLALYEYLRSGDGGTGGTP